MVETTEVQEVHITKHNKSNPFTILAVGPVGGGKSTVLNAVAGRQRFKTGSHWNQGDYSVTKKVEVYERLGGGQIPIKVIDTPGMGDHELPLDELSKDIDATLQG